MNAALAGLLLLAAAGADPGPTDYSPPAWQEAPTPGGLLLQLGGLTAVAIVCAAVVVWWARKAGALPPTVSGYESALTVVDRLALDGRTALYLIEVEGAAYVVGIDAAGLKSIQAVPEAFDEALARELPAEDIPAEDGPARSAA